MGEHSELLKDARDLADEREVLSGIPGKSGMTAKILRTLADLVEAYAKSQPELVAACETCDEVITEFIAHYPSRQRQLWEKLDAARHLVRRAAKLPEPPIDWDRWHELMDKPSLTTNEKEEYEEYARIARELDAEEGKVADASLEKLVAEHERVIASIRRLTVALRAEPPPIEVEMRVQHTCSGWTWKTQLVGRWVFASCLEGVGEAYFHGRLMPKAAGNTWLSALSQRLGVPLVAQWADGE